jgi:SpoVK/Ycf46/Vps4 family AAA+-type ATPase
LGLRAIARQAAARDGRIDPAVLGGVKKELIESQCGGLLEFVEPSFTLEMVVGHEAVKQQLRADAALLAQGHLDAVPMGYLVCGPVGTGKSFLAECFAGTVGVPAVKLRNFRSKYVGETEANLERILTVLRAMGPVVVVIDEADAALGSREASGDSGTSARVFAQIAAQMGDTRYRGRILWMLLTCRPDLLPIDLKRPGRAEIHLPLLPPDTPEEVTAMFVAMGRKNGVVLDPAGATGVSPERGLTGADIEAIVLDARRRALVHGTGDLSADELAESARTFVPAVDNLEKELQRTAAILETTNVAFLPEPLRAEVLSGNRRRALAARLEELKRMVGS